MKIRNNFAPLVVAVAVVISLPHALLARTVTTKSTPQDREASVAKVIRLLQDSGLTHRKTGANTWVIERQGKSMLVAAGTDFLVLGIIVAVKKNMRVSADLQFKLLKLNHSLDYAKVGFDDDDDLFVRTEARLRLIDLEAFKSMVNDVGNGAVKAQNEVRPFLVTP